MKPPSLAPLYCTIYPAMAEVARAHGYALAVHGSAQRDLDLIAVPWTAAAGDPDDLVRALCFEVGRIMGDDPVIGWTPRGAPPAPHGRVGYSLPLDLNRSGRDDPGYIDISVMPRSPASPAPPVTEPLVHVDDGQGFRRADLDDASDLEGSTTEPPK